MLRVACTILFSFLLLNVFSQKPHYKHHSILGIHFSLQDFKNPSPLKNMQKLDGGLSATYFKGINNRFDWQVGLNASFPDSTSKTISVKGSASLLLQADFSMRTRLVGSNRSFQPYLLTGLGMAHHQEKMGAYFLLGPGIELGYKDVYFLLNAQYRAALNAQINSHYYYSIGIAGLLSKPKKKKPARASREVQQPVLSDKDRDGVLDSLDLCPDQPGLPRLKGCPDEDRDGIMDKEDQCPTVPGLERYKGCPVPDRDQDGIYDEEDGCPAVPGTHKYRGCPVPDTDGDGVNDEEDRCIEMAGVKENQGCPLVNKEITRKIDTAAKNIFFKSGSYQLLAKSFVALDQVAQILKENKTLALIIEGHTDNVDSAPANQLLSENRAKAVVEYLISKGIEKSRLTAIGYGMQRPIEDNGSAEGRAKNRRVEIKVN